MDCRRGLQTVDLVNISWSKDPETITDATPRETQSLQRVASRQNPVYRTDVCNTAGSNPASGAEWLYEVKFDGYRCLAGGDSSGVTLWSRRGNLFTKQFPHIAGACEQLPPGTLVDGEIVALDENGRVSFNLLQHHRSEAQALLFYVFDVLVYRGRSLLKEPLEHRRQVLAETIKGKAAPIALSESLDASLKDLFRVAKEFGFEGIVAKRKDSAYQSGKRTGAWVKYRVNRGQEFVIGGYTPANPFDARKR